MDAASVITPRLTNGPWLASDASIIALSVQVALVSVCLSLPAAIGLAWLLARRNFPGKVLLDALVHLPLVLPPVVTGYMLLSCFGRSGWLGPLLEPLGIRLYFSWRGAAVASAVMSFPLMLRAIRLSMEAADPRMEKMARTLGASAWATFLEVTLPAAAPGIAGGVLLGFTRSLGEFGATISFVGNLPDETRTLPLAIFDALQSPDGESQALRLSIYAFLLAAGSLIASETLAARQRRQRDPA